MKDGDRVRIKNGEYKGKTGKAIGPIPMSPMQNLVPGKDMGGVILLWAVKFDDGSGDTAEEESNLEIIEE